MRSLSRRSGRNDYKSIRGHGNKDEVIGYCDNVGFKNFINKMKEEFYYDTDNEKSPKFARSLVTFHTCYAGGLFEEMEQMDFKLGFDIKCSVFCEFGHGSILLLLVFLDPGFRRDDD